MKNLVFTALLVPLLFCFTQSNASHAAGGELTYEHLSGNTYRFTFKFFRDCTGVNEPFSVPLCIRNLCTNTSLSGINLSKIGGNIPGTSKPNGSPTSTGCPGFPTTCQSAVSPVPGYEEWWYQGTYTLPTAGTCDQWRFSTYIGARNTSTNINGGYFYVEAYLNRRPVANGPVINNNSPTFALAPIPYYCANQPTTYSNGTVETDGDSLNFVSITPMNQGGCNFVTPTQCNYTNAAFNNTNNPFSTNNTFVVNPINGAINFTPNMVQTPTISIRVNEYRNGILIGYVMRDIQMVILNCTAPNPVFAIDTNLLSGGVISPNGIDVCAGTPLNLCFDITSASPTAVLTVNDNHATQAVGSILNYTSLLTPAVTGCLTWTPTIADTGLHIITINTTDSACTPPGILIGQTFTLSINVKSSSLIQATATDPSCAGNDGSITAVAAGASGFILLPGNVSNTTGVFNNLSAGNYVVSLQGAVCATSLPLMLNPPPNPVKWNSINVTNTSCTNPSSGSIIASANGGTSALTYGINPVVSPNNSTGIFSNLTAGSYVISVTDTNNCSNDTTVAITIPANPVVSFTSILQPNCLLNSGEILVGGTTNNPPLTYTLNGLTTNQTGIFPSLNQGGYSIIATDNAGCTSSLATILQLPPLPTWTSITRGDLTCIGSGNGWITGVANSAASPLSYTLQPGNLISPTGSFSNLSGGQYTIIASDTNFCDTAFSVFLNAPLAMLWDSTSAVNVDCNGSSTGQIYVSARSGNGGVVYSIANPSLSNTSGLFTGLPAAIYTVIATDANGCTISTTIGVEEPSVLQIEQVDFKQPTCIPGNDGTITIAALGGVQPYVYSAGGPVQASNIILNVSSGNYTVVVQDANGCTVSSPLSIAQNPIVYFDSIKYTIPTCYGDDNGIIEVFANGGSGDLAYTINGSPATTNTYYNNLSSGTYTINASDSLNCRADSAFILPSYDPVRLDQLDLYSVICKGQEDGYVLSEATGGQGDYTYYMRPGIRFNKTGDFSGLKKGVYSLSVKDKAQCSFDTLIIIDEPIAITSSIAKRNLNCKGFGNEGEAEVNVTGGVSPLTYTWTTDPIQTNARATGLRYGWYFVNVVDAIGCEISDSVYIDPGNCCTDVFFPNAFSPNGDGRNDEFRLISSAGLVLKQFEIYNRWGQRVWHTYTYHDSWNGMFGGERAAPGAYYYVFRYDCTTDGKEYIKKGDIILIR